MGSAEPNSQESFDKEKLIVNDIIERPKDAFVKYGVVQFETDGSVKVPLGDYKDEDELKDDVRKLPLREGKGLDEGIKSAMEEFEKSGRPKSRRVMVVFIDGNDDTTKEKLEMVAEPLKKKYIKVIPVVLAENVDEEKLKPLLPKKKKPVKGEDPKKLGEEIAEEALRGKRLEILESFLIRKYHNSSFFLIRSMLCCRV